MPDYSFHHVHLFSPDPMKTAAFYQETLNAELVSSAELPDGGVRVELKLGGTRVLIAKREAEAGSASSPAPAGLDHLGLRTDDIEASVADLKSRGVRFRDEIRMIPSGLKIAFFWAPQDVLIEVLEVKPNPQ